VYTCSFRYSVIVMNTMISVCKIFFLHRRTLAISEQNGADNIQQVTGEWSFADRVEFASKHQNCHLN